MWSNMCTVFFQYYVCIWSQKCKEKKRSIIRTALSNFQYFGSPCSKSRKKSLSEVKMYKTKVVKNCSSYCSKFFSFWRNLKNKVATVKKNYPFFTLFEKRPKTRVMYLFFWYMKECLRRSVDIDNTKHLVAKKPFYSWNSKTNKSVFPPFHWEISWFLSQNCLMKHVMWRLIEHYFSSVMTIDHSHRNRVNLKWK